jgi:hypothetical protein
MGCSQGKTSSPTQKSQADQAEVNRRRLIADDNGRTPFLLGSPDPNKRPGHSEETASTATPSLDDELKPQEVSARDAEAGPVTEMQTASRLIETEKAFTIGSRVAAEKEIKYNEEFCIPKGTLGTISFVLHRSLWVNWDGWGGPMGEADNAVVLASQIRVVDDPGRKQSAEQFSAAQQRGEGQQHPSTSSPSTSSTGASNFPEPPRLVAASPHLLFPSSSTEDKPKENLASNSRSTEAEVGKAIKLLQRLGTAQTPASSNAGDKIHLQKAAAESEVKPQEKSEPKSDEKAPRKDKSDFCCC